MRFRMTPALPPGDEPPPKLIARLPKLAGNFTSENGMSDKQQLNTDAKWELVEQGDSSRAFDCVHHLRVPGGWIYRVFMTEPGGGNPAVSAVFVPEPLQGGHHGLGMGTGPLYTAKVAGDA